MNHYYFPGKRHTDPASRKKNEMFTVAMTLQFSRFLSSFVISLKTLNEASSQKNMNIVGAKHQTKTIIVRIIVHAHFTGLTKVTNNCDWFLIFVTA